MSVLGSRTVRPPGPAEVEPAVEHKVVRRGVRKGEL